MCVYFSDSARDGAKVLLHLWLFNHFLIDGVIITEYDGFVNSVVCFCCINRVNFVLFFVNISFTFQYLGGPD